MAARITAADVERIEARFGQAFRVRGRRDFYVDNYGSRWFCTCGHVVADDCTHIRAAKEVHAR
jgi:hypothetical protein